MATKQVYTLTANGQATDWMDNTSLQEPYVVNGALTAGTGTILLEASNDASSAKGDTVTVETYTGSFTKKLVKPFPRYIRYRVTALAGGNWIIGFGRSVDTKGNPVDVSAQGTQNVPSQNFA